MAARVLLPPQFEQQRRHQARNRTAMSLVTEPAPEPSRASLLPPLASVEVWVLFGAWALLGCPYSASGRV